MASNQIVVRRKLPQNAPMFLCLADVFTGFLVIHAVAPVKKQLHNCKLMHSILLCGQKLSSYTLITPESSSTFPVVVRADWGTWTLLFTLSWIDSRRKTWPTNFLKILAKIFFCDERIQTSWDDLAQ